MPTHIMIQSATYFQVADVSIRVIYAACFTLSAKICFTILV